MDIVQYPCMRQLPAYCSCLHYICYISVILPITWKCGGLVYVSQLTHCYIESCGSSITGDKFWCIFWLMKASEFLVGSTVLGLTDESSLFCTIIVSWWIDSKPLFISLKHNDAHGCQKSRPSSVQIMACQLFGTKPLSEPMLAYLLRNQ